MKSGWMAKCPCKTFFPTGKVTNWPKYSSSVSKRTKQFLKNCFIHLWAVETLMFTAFQHQSAYKICIFLCPNISHMTYRWGNPNRLFRNFVHLTNVSQNVWKNLAVQAVNGRYEWTGCKSNMTQIWHVCVCLLELSLLYPAPHMDTAMLRISPSFLTKPSEQLAKNNMTCCLRSELRPPGEDITGGGRSRFAF